MRIRTRGNQAFNVPNDEEGQSFLRLLRKFRNRGWYYRARGRGPRDNGLRAHCPQDKAEWLAVYLKHKRDWAPGDQMTGDEFQELVYALNKHDSDPAAGVFVPPKQIMVFEMAEDSAPFIAGSPVAIAEDGKVYNSAPHGLRPGTYDIGVAVAESEGGTVHAILDELPEPAAYEPYEQESEPVGEPEGDVTDITAEEHDFLERILISHWKSRSGYYSDKEQAILDSLVGKLTD